MPSLDQKHLTLEFISIVCSSFSVIGSSFIVASWLRFSAIRKRLGYTLVFYVALSDLTRAIANTWGAPPTKSPFCTAQGFLKNFGGVSSFLWIGVICVVLYTTVHHPLIWQVPEEVIARRRIWLNFVWLVSLGLSCLPLVWSDYVNLGSWCWIDGVGHVDHILRWVCFYGVLFVVFFGVSTTYCFLSRYVKRMRHQTGVKIANDRAKQLFQRVRFYPLVLFVCFFFGFLRRTMQAFKYEPPFAISVLHIGLSSLYGLSNAVVYGYTQSVRQEWRDADGIVRSLSNRFESRRSAQSSSATARARVGSSNAGSHDLEMPVRAPMTPQSGSPLATSAASLPSEISLDDAHPNM